MAPKPVRRFRSRRAAIQASRWSLVRKTAQLLALALFLWVFLSAGAGPALQAQWLLQIDPLLMLANLLASRTFQTAALLGLFFLLLPLALGRAWCGWLCPLGGLIDLISPSPGRQQAQLGGPQSRLRSLKIFLLLAILGAALVGSLSLLIFDPLTILFRFMTAAAWPLADRLVTRLEMATIGWPALSGPVGGFDAWLRPAVLPLQPAAYREAFTSGLLLAGILGLNWLAPRFWCRYLCPLGGLLAVFSRPALVRRNVSPDCTGCGLCEAACPTGTIDPRRNYASDPAECTLCMDCLTACPRSTISFSPGLHLPPGQPYDPGRRQALVTIAAAAAGAALLQTERLLPPVSPNLLRPPGVIEDDLLSRCLRCSACVRVCPTSGLQPAALQAGLEGLWTPRLEPRLGYCDYACNRCGQICPVQAIPPLALEEKRQQVIGKASIDHERCIAWAEQSDCIVCEEMCPIPDKAIHLEPPATFQDGAAPVSLPYVNRERCIGCGICENKCPAPGMAAIRVYAVA